MAISVQTQVRGMINTIIRHQGSVRKAASAIGSSPTTLYRWGASHGLGQKSYGITRLTLPSPSKMRRIENLYSDACRDLDIVEVGPSGLPVQAPKRKRLHRPKHNFD